MSKIKDYEVHPVAHMFPLIAEDSREWKDLVQSFETVGQIEPIVVDGKILLDGRNRLRVCEVLKLEPRISEWSALGLNVGQADWIAAKNLDRRHLTPDQRAAIGCEIESWKFKESAKKRKEATQLAGKNSDGTPKRKSSARSNSTEPNTPRDHKKESENSTAGQIAKLTGISIHKAKQALKLAAAVENGVIPAEVIAEVKAGKQTLRKAVKKIPAKPKTVEFRKEIENRFTRFMGKYPVATHPEVKAVIKALLK